MRPREESSRRMGQQDYWHSHKTGHLFENETKTEPVQRCTSETLLEGRIKISATKPEISFVLL